MQSTIPGQKNSNRKGVEDANGDIIKVGDTVRHNSNGTDAVVKSTHIATANGARYPEIDVDAASGPWDPKQVRKVTPGMELKRRR
jgi:hypothetical protein